MYSGAAEQTLSPPRPPRRVRGAAHADGLALFHRTLAEMCRAEVPLPRALRLLGEELERGELAREAEAMAAEIEQGGAVEEVLARRGALFPPHYVALVGAGIAAGELPAVLEEIAEDASRRARQGDRMRRALAYPLTAAIFVGALAVLLLFFVTPPTAMIPNSQFGLAYGDVPVDTASSGWATFGLVGGIALLGTLVVLGFAWLRRPLDAGSAPRRFAYRVPFLGRLRLLAAKASFTWSMAMLLRRELPLPRAFALAAATLDDPRFTETLRRMSARAAEGEDLAATLREGELLPASLLWMVEAASTSASSAKALADISEVYRRRFERAVDRFCVLATPLAELAVGLAVLAFALSYALPSLRFIDKILGG